MKINFDAVLLDLDEKPIDGGTLKTIALQVLTATFADENLTGEQKVNRYRLALQINKGGEQEITLEDAVLLKMLIGKGYPPLIVGRSYELINGA